MSDNEVQETETENANAGNDSEGDESALPDWAKTKLSKANREAANYRTQLRKEQEDAKAWREYQETQKTEIEKAQERAATAEAEAAAAKAEALRNRIAADRKVPASLLNGSTEEELTAAADALLEFRGAASDKAPPATDFVPGRRGTAVAAPKDVDGWIRNASRR